MPSPGVNAPFPNSPFKRIRQVSAGATRSPKNDSRFRLYTHKTRLMVVAPEYYFTPPAWRPSDIQPLPPAAPLKDPLSAGPQPRRQLPYRFAAVALD